MAIEYTRRVAFSLLSFLLPPPSSEMANRPFSYNEYDPIEEYHDPSSLNTYAEHEYQHPGRFADIADIDYADEIGGSMC